MMNQEFESMRDPRTRWVARGKAEVQDSCMLVLLDSSELASNLLEFALSVASTHRWDIHLLQVVDLDELPELANGLAAGRRINAEYRRFIRRIESFREVILASGVSATIADPVVMSARQLDGFQRSVHEIKPDMIIVGRQSFSRTFLYQLTRQTTCPLMIVPEMCRKFTPSSILLYSNNRRLHEYHVFPLLRLATVMNLSISIMSVLNRKGRGTRRYESFLPTSSCATPVSYYQLEGKDTLSSVDGFLRRKSFGIVSLIQTNEWRIWSLFRRWTCVDLSHRVNVPVLVFKAK